MEIIDGFDWATMTYRPKNLTHETTAELKPPPEKPKKGPVVIEAMPWEPLPEGYPDYRPALQRDGLILLAWERYGDDLKIVWCAANGGMRKYQAWADDESEFPAICPERKYEEGRCLYRDDEEPDYIIYAAPPDLTVRTKSAFVARLKAIGVSVNFDYEFSLGKQRAAREAAVLDKIENRQGKKPSSFEEFINGIDEIFGDGTIDRWNRERAEKKARKNRRRVALCENNNLEVIHG